MNQEKPNPETKHSHPHNGKPVIQYIMVMFIAAFLLMALSLVMHQRTTSEGIGELQHSFSAMQSIQSQQEKVIELQDALNDADSEREALEKTIRDLEDQMDQDDMAAKAMEQLYILQQQYLAEDYDHCRATIQTMETLDLDELLSTKKEYSVPSPAETFQAIKAELEAMEADVSRETTG